MKYLYYGFGGGLGHITRFLAFCNTFKIKPVLLTVNCHDSLVKNFASNIYVLPKNLIADKTGLREWVKDCIRKEKPDKFIIDAFPCGILGELSDLEELNNIEVEYIARILKLNEYKKRIDGEFPKFNKIWQIEKLGEEQQNWLKELADINSIPINQLELDYPDSKNDSMIEIPDNSWLIIHSGSEEELQTLYEYAKDIISLECIKPNLIVIGQIAKPDFISREIPYYSVYPVTNLLKKVTKVVSGAGFNMVYQMRKMKDKHILLPFERALDDQFLRIKLNA